MRFANQGKYSIIRIRRDVEGEKEMKKWLEKSMLGIVIFLMAFILCVPVQAASKYTGTYSKVYKNYEGAASDVINPTYAVVINKVTKKKVRLQVEFVGRNGSPLYQTKVITAKRNGKNASFTWKDSWGNSGTGKIKLRTGYVKIKMIQTKTAGINRSTLERKSFLKLKKKNNKKRVYVW